MHSILKCISDHSETDQRPLSCLCTSFLGLCVCFLGREHPFGRWSQQMTATCDQLPPPCPPGHMVTSFFPLGLALHPFGNFLMSPGSARLLAPHRHSGGLTHTPDIPGTPGAPGPGACPGAPGAPGPGACPGEVRRDR